MVQSSSLHRLPPPCATQCGVPSLLAPLVQPSRSHRFGGIAPAHPLPRLKMNVVKTLHLEVREHSSVWQRSPHIHIHPYTSMPCVHGASPEETQKPQRSSPFHSSWVVINLTRDVFTQETRPLGTIHTAQTRKPSAFAAALVPMSDAVGELHLSARDEPRPNLNTAAMIQSDCP